MAYKINPLEILKRIYVRYYSVITLLSLLSLYGASHFFPGANIPLALLLYHISQSFCWLLIILVLWSFDTGRSFIHIMTIVCTSLLGVLISYMGLAWLLDFEPFHFVSSPLSGNVFILMLLIVIICSATTILSERSLIVEQKYTEEKTGRLLSEKKLVEDQLNLLQAQIEPQFLFNTMESICNLYDTDPERANTMQMYFIQYLRETLIKTRARTTTIEQEIDLIRSYMNIIKVSMQDRLDYEIDVDIQAKELHFPSLLIQPIVENLIKHGLEKTPEGGRISIFVKKRIDMLHIRIAHTVRHLNVENILEPIITNIQDRLKSLFENKWIIKLEDNQPKGLVVVIEVPCG